MNPFTQLIWEVITDHPAYLTELTSIMQQEHKPFLTREQAFQANTNMLEAHIREGVEKWYEWLPETPIHYIAGSLAVEMLDSVDWDQLAALV